MQPLKMNIGTLTCIPFDWRVFDLSTVWLENPELRHLINAQEMSFQQRLEWFEALPQRSDYIIRAIALDAKPIGCFGLKHIDPLTHRAEYWSYLGERIHWGLGIGPVMLRAGCLIAQELDITQLYVQIASHNERSKRMCQKVGFHHTRDIPGGVEMNAFVASLLDTMNGGWSTP